MNDEDKRIDSAGKGDGSKYLEYFKSLHKDDDSTKQNADDFGQFFSNLIDSSSEKSNENSSKGEN